MGNTHGGGQCRGPGHSGHGGCRGCRGNPFTNHMANLGHGMLQQLQHIGGFPGAALSGNLPPPQQGMQRGGMSHSNMYKCYNNWNVCFSCGFDVKDSHTSLTRPFQKVNHQTGIHGGMRNSSLWQDTTPAPRGCIVGSPNVSKPFSQCRVEILSLAQKCKNSLSATSCPLDLTILKISSYIDDDTATVVTFNCTKKLTRQPQLQQRHELYLATPCHIFKRSKYCNQPSHCRHGHNFHLHYGGC